MNTDHILSLWLLREWCRHVDTVEVPYKRGLYELNCGLNSTNFRTCEGLGIDGGKGIFTENYNFSMSRRFTKVFGVNLNLKLNECEMGRPGH